MSAAHGRAPTAHARGLRVTGHLCAVGFREAVAIGIDNIEHGLPFDTELYSDKRKDECPNQWNVFDQISRMDVGDVAVRETIRQLVTHGVASDPASLLAGAQGRVGEASLDVGNDLMARHRRSHSAAGRCGQAPRRIPKPQVIRVRRP